MEEVELPQHIYKNLIEKSEEKRQYATKEVEKLIGMAIEKKNEKSIKNIIDHFRVKFIHSSKEPNMKKAGLSALAAIAQALTRDETLAEKYVTDITHNMLECFSDRDDKIRYSGIEYLYYVCRCLKDIVLINFNEIFTQLINKIADVDDGVRKAAFQLDNKLKSIINEALPERRHFDIAKFMPVLKEKMKAKNPVVRNLLLSWINTLDSIPNLEFFEYLPDVLEDLFMMLGDQQKGVRESAEKCLNDFLHEIDGYAKRNAYKNESEQQIHERILDTLIHICNQKGNNFAKVAAIQWIIEYVKLFQKQLEEEQGPTVQMGSQNFLRTSQYPDNVFNEGKEESPLRRTIMQKLSDILEPILALLSHEEEDIRRAAHKTNDLLLKLMDRLKNTEIELEKIMPTVKQMFTEKKSNTESVLIWMRHLLQTYSDKQIQTIDDILSKLIDRLNDPEPQVVQNVMDVLGSISLHEQYFDLVVEKILNVFEKNNEILQKKSEIIIKKLCAILNPQRIFTTISVQLLQKYTDDVEFISMVTQTLNYLLITDKVLAPIHKNLRNLKYANNKEHIKFFQTLYYTFCYNPVSTISLCFLAQEYHLAYHIILSLQLIFTIQQQHQLSQSQETDVDTLIQVAKLINLIESPQFSYLRLQLIESEKHPYLVKCLQGLMMILPQTQAYNKLKQRLKHSGNSIKMDPMYSRQEQITYQKSILETEHLLGIYMQTRKNIQVLQESDSRIQQQQQF